MERDYKAVYDYAINWNEEYYNKYGCLPTYVELTKADFKIIKDYFNNNPFFVRYENREYKSFQSCPMIHGMKIIVKD